MRVYDARIAKFVSVDPITSQYPELTPYQFASNSPIANIDLDGAEAYEVKGPFLVPQPTSDQHGFKYAAGTVYQGARAAEGGGASRNSFTQLMLWGVS